MPRVCTNLRTTPGLFKKWRHEALYYQAFCLDICTTWGYFELLCLSLEYAFIKIWSDPNPSKTTKNHQREKTKQILLQTSQWITKWLYYVAWLWYLIFMSFRRGLSKVIYSEVVLGSVLVLMHSDAFHSFKIKSNANLLLIVAARYQRCISITAIRRWSQSELFISYHVKTEMMIQRGTYYCNSWGHIM